MARMVTTKRVVISTVGAWLAGFLIFFPILWMVLTSFKTELEAFAMPPSFLFFHWTTENYATVQERSDYLHHALNSIIIAGGSTLIAMLIAIPAAWSMAFSPTKRTKDILLWMLSTKMMPPVGVLVPIYLIFKNFGLLDTRTGLDLHPLPRQSADRGLDALHLFQGDPEGHPGSRAHGRRDHRPRAGLCADADGGAGTGLDAVAQSDPGLERGVLDAEPVDLAGRAAHRRSSRPIRARKGLFWAKLSAASTLAIAPILVLGWFSQRQLVRGLTFGAVK